MKSGFKDTGPYFSLERMYQETFTWQSLGKQLIPTLNMPLNVYARFIDENDIYSNKYLLDRSFNQTLKGWIRNKHKSQVFQTKVKNFEKQIFSWK